MLHDPDTSSYRPVPSAMSRSTVRLDPLRTTWAGPENCDVPGSPDGESQQVNVIWPTTSTSVPSAGPQYVMVIWPVAEPRAVPLGWS
jgi:hypothetical protein